MPLQTAEFPYVSEEVRQALLDRRARWTAAEGVHMGDTTGRRPLAGLPRPELEGDPDPRNRDPRQLARQFARVLDATPAFVDPLDPVPGAFGWMLCELIDMPHMGWWSEELTASRPWGADGVGVNIGMPGHWAPDVSIGLRLGWSGIRRRIAESPAWGDRSRHAYLEALDAMAAASQEFVRRHAEQAWELAGGASGKRAEALRALAEVIDAVAEQPPGTFWQAVVWLGFYMVLNRAYNGANILGRLDQVLLPFYEADVKAGRLNDEQATLLIQSLLVHDTHFICLGGREEDGRDVSNALTRLILRAWDGIGGSANIGLRVSESTPDDLLDLACGILLSRGHGTPTLVNDEAIEAGLVAKGMAPADATNYAWAGCHWWGVPGKQFGLSDGTKIVLPTALQAAWGRMMDEGDPSLQRLWDMFAEAVRNSFAHAAQCYALHLEHAPRINPELFGSLLTEDAVAKGQDVFGGSLPYNFFLADAMGLANVVDAMSALDALVERKGLYSFRDFDEAIARNFEGCDAMLAALDSAPKFGNDDPRADDWARRIASLCVEASAGAEPEDGRFRILPGFYSWLAHIMCAGSEATPDGRRRGQSLSHGANPNEGKVRAGLTAMAASVAAAQTACGASAPLHLEITPDLFGNSHGTSLFRAYVQAFFARGGTQVICNVASAEKLRRAMAEPNHHADMTVRVTGFSAVFVHLDPTVQEDILQRYERP